MRNILIFMLVFVWTVYLKPEAQIGPLEGKESITFQGTVSINRFSIQGKVLHSREELIIPYSSILFVQKGYPPKTRAGR